jgi:tRNA/tmRNA/rRNA uracil-C5-methylase (TrmA/RlmC/RlmD family)
VTGESLELVVERVAHGGVCVARADDGRVVFVRHAVPGERVVAVVTEERTSYLRADVVEVLDASPHRVVPPCPFAGPGRCGGCDWQHVAVPHQRELKAAVVHEQLARLAHLDLPVVVEEVPGAKDGLGWRTRVRFAVDHGVIGLRKHRSHDIEPIDSCLIAHPEVEALGVETKRWPGAAEVDVAVSAATGDRHVDVIAAGRRHPHVPWLDAPTGVSIDGQPLGGRRTVRERAVGREWHISAGGFWQVHPGAAEALAAAVVDAVRAQPGETVLDLYAGVGLFAAALAPAVGGGGDVVAVESEAAAVEDAARTLRDLPQVQLVRARVEKWLQGEVPPADVVVLDPPRSGAGRVVVERLARVTRRAVAYVACDPAALARDIATFAEHGWRLSSLRAFDLFPMTAHVECVALLEPAGS